MGELALAICLKEGGNINNEGKRLNNIAANALKFISGKVKKMKIENWFSWVEATGNSGFYLIKLPYEISELRSLNKNRIKGLSCKISQVCSKKNIDVCILPGLLEDIFECDGIFKNSFKGRLLYKSILINIIKRIYREESDVINDLDVVVIHGNDNDELLHVINILSGFVRYITLVTGCKEAVENEVSNIFENTGLAVGITSDNKNTLKNSHLVVNLGSLSIDFNTYSGSASTKVVINYGETYVKNPISGNVSLIEGAIIKLPEKVLRKLEKEIFLFFNETEIAEILISSKAGAINSFCKGNLGDLSLNELMALEFDSGGYEISGFTGKNSNIRIKNICMRV